MSGSPVALPIVAELQRVGNDSRSSHKRSFLALAALNKLSSKTVAANRYRDRLARRILRALPSLSDSEALSTLNQLDTLLAPHFSCQEMTSLTARFRQVVPDLMCRSKSC